MYLLEFLETCRRHVRVPPHLGAPGWREATAKCANLRAALTAQPRVAVPPNQRLRDRRLQH